MDFSCYIKITNNLDLDLKRVSFGAEQGYWAKEPPDVISAQTSSVEFQLKDNFGFYGSEGYVAYECDFPLINEGFTLNFACPTGNNDNYITNNLTNQSICEISYRAKYDNAQWEYNSCPKRGHPLYIEYTFDYKPILTNSYVENIIASGNYSIQNSQGIITNYKVPIWTNSQSYNDGQYSTHPVAFSSGSQNIFTLSMCLDKEMNKVPFLISGYIDTRKIFESKTIIGTPGTISIPINFVSSAVGVQQIYGDVSWEITVLTNNQKISLPKTTRVELYWLLSNPSSMFTKGVWVTLLRNIFPYILPGSTKPDLINALAGFCFSNKEFQKTYDTYQGKNGYVQADNGGFFDIRKYFTITSNQTPLANCSDQAAVLQTALGSLGVQTYWIQQSPFGFINTTNLLGIGQCNNPFFNNPKYKNNPVVNINDPKRTMFNQHSYLIDNLLSMNQAFVLDCCQGPYQGSIKVQDYINQIIDTKTNLYQNYSGQASRPGTIGDLYSSPGVISVETITDIEDLVPSPNHKLVVRLLNDKLSELSKFPSSEHYFECSRDDIFNEKLLSLGCSIQYSRQVLGHRGIYEVKTLDISGIAIEMSVWISSLDRSDAVQHLFKEVSSIEIALTEEDIHLVPELGSCAVAIGNGNQYLLWVNRNVFVSLYAPNDFNLLPLAQEINNTIDRALVKGDERNLLLVDKPYADREAIMVGEEVGISFPSNQDWIEYDFEGDGRLEIVSITNDLFRFKAVSCGRVTVTFLVGNAKSSTVVTQAINLNIAEKVRSLS